MTIDIRTGSLIAVGASMTANCQSCLDINAARARKGGASAQEIADAIEIGRKVRAGAASKMDAFVATLDVAAPSRAVADAGCGGGS